MARIAEDADDLEARDLVTAAVSRSMAKHPDLFAGEVLSPRSPFPTEGQSPP